MDSLPETPIASILTFITGFLTAVLAEPIRKKLYKAKLRISFENNPDHLALTPERQDVQRQTTDGRSLPTWHFKNEAVYIRVNVQNNSTNPAHDCRAYLINIERKMNDKFEPTIYCDLIPLSWSCQNIGEQYNGLEIIKGVKQFLDVVTVRDTSKDFDPQIKVKPFRYEEVFQQKGIFRFTIRIIASNADPLDYRLILEWDGDWKTFKAYQG